jgi:hypothetical protein
MVIMPLPWSANEEDYFQLAYRRVAPDKFSELHAVFDHSNARILFESLLGTLISWLGYEKAHTIARAATALFYAIGLGVLLRSLGITFATSLGALTLFMLAGEHILGEEWLFDGVEAKTFAYASIALAMGWVIQGYRWRAIPALALATYLHFLVGGFWSLAILSLMLLQGVPLKKGMTFGAVYTVLIAPLLAFIILDQFGDSSVSPADRATAHYLYAARVSHHVAPFLNKEQTLAWSSGMIEAASLLMLFILVAWREGASLFPKFIFYLLCFLVVAIVLSYLDRKGYVLAKFYLFRPSSFILLLAILELLRTLRDSLAPAYRSVWAATLLVITLNYLWHLYVEVKTMGPLIESKPLVEAIHKLSGKNDLVLLQPTQGQYNTDMGDFIHIHRYLERPTLVSWKFVPANTGDILRWKKLIDFRRHLFDAGCEKPLDYPVAFMVVFDRATLDKYRSCGDVVWQDPEATIIRVNDAIRSP